MNIYLLHHVILSRAQSQKIHPSTAHYFFPLRSGTIVNVSFFCNAFISSVMVWIHLGSLIVSSTLLGTWLEDNLCAKVLKDLDNL